MAGISGQGTTFGLPNYVGALFSITPTETPFLSAIGGLTGGERTSSSLFQWQGYDLRTPEANRAALEGANAPTADERVRANVINVTEIHHEKVSVSYSKQTYVGQYATTGSNHAGSVGISGTNPVADEHAWQVSRALEAIALDVELSFLLGEFQNPANNSTPRKTGGILEAIETNEVDAEGGELDRDLILELVRTVFISGGMRNTSTLMVDAYAAQAVSDIFITDRGYQETSRTIGGVAVRTILTPYGELNVMLNRHMPATSVALIDLRECAPVFAEVPGMGFLFEEPLAKTGSSKDSQIYGEIGLKWGNEKRHGKIINLIASS